MPMQGATLPVAAAHHQPPPVHTGFWHGGGSWHAGHNSWSGSSGHAHPAAAGSNATPVAGWNGTFQGRVARTSLEFHPLVLRVPGVRPHQLVFGSSSQQQQQCIRVSLFGLWQLAVASLLGWSCSSRQQLVGQPSPSPAAGAGPASSACEPRACGAVSRTRVAAVAGALCSAVQCTLWCGMVQCGEGKARASWILAGARAWRRCRCRPAALLAPPQSLCWAHRTMSCAVAVQCSMCAVCTATRACTQIWSLDCGLHAWLLKLYSGWRTTEQHRQGGGLTWQPGCAM
jgi:hypothetical protein